MIKKIKQKLQKEEHKRLLSNFISLVFLQGANYILPLITFPYLVRVLGVENYGLLAFAGATVAYFGILTDYGFNLTATREVSIYRDNKEKLNEIFSSVMIIKFILMVVSFILLLLLIFSVNKFKQDDEIFILTFGTVIGQVLFPQWFFQGIERMKYITFLNILAKVIFTIAIFVFIHKSSDFWKVPLINSLGFIVAGILALYIIFKDFKIKFSFQSFNTLKHYFLDGWHIFISGIFTLFYTITPIFLLGIFTNNVIVGYYSIAEKVIKIASSIFNPINSAFYPFIIKKIKASKKEGLRILKKLTLYSFYVMLVITIFIFMFSPYIIFLISGKYIQESIDLLRILSFFPIIIILAKIFSFDYLIANGYQKYLVKIYFYSAMLSIFLFVILIPLFKAKGTAISVIIVEVFATFYMYLVIKKKGLL